MKKCKFDEFINGFDQATKGRYSYYYRWLWDACKYADDRYLEVYDETVWAGKKNGALWLKGFDEFMRDKEIDESFKKNVHSQLDEWLEVI